MKENLNLCGGEGHFVDSVGEVLKSAEKDEVEDGEEDGVNRGRGERYRSKVTGAR